MTGTYVDWYDIFRLYHFVLGLLIGFNYHLRFESILEASQCAGVFIYSKYMPGILRPREF